MLCSKSNTLLTNNVIWNIRPVYPCFIRYTKNAYYVCVAMFFPTEGTRHETIQWHGVLKRLLYWMTWNWCIAYTLYIWQYNYEINVLSNMHLHYSFSTKCILLPVWYERNTSIPETYCIWNSIKTNAYSRFIKCSYTFEIISFLLFKRRRNSKHAYFSVIICVSLYLGWFCDALT